MEDDGTLEVQLFRQRQVLALKFKGSYNEARCVQMVNLFCFSVFTKDNRTKKVFTCRAPNLGRPKIITYYVRALLFDT